MSAINETLIRDVVTEVLGRLGGQGPAPASPAPSKPDCGCTTGNGRPSGGSLSRGGGSYGVFQDATEACTAAQQAFLQLKKQGVAARVKVVEIVKTMAEANA